MFDLYLQPKVPPEVALLAVIGALTLGLIYILRETDRD